MSKKLMLLSILLFLGCATIPVTETSPVPQNPSQVIFNTIQSTDWLLSILLIGAVLGMFAGFNGVKTGWAGVAACVGGIVLKAALSSTYVYWVCGLLFLGCVLTAVASVIWKNKAVKELILSTQQLKQHVDGESQKAIFSTTQSKDTVGLINRVKAVLKTKGQI